MSKIFYPLALFLVTTPMISHACEVGQGFYSPTNHVRTLHTITGFDGDDTITTTEFGDVYVLSSSAMKHVICHDISFQKSAKPAGTTKAVDTSSDQAPTTAPATYQTTIPDSDVDATPASI